MQDQVGVADLPIFRFHFVLPCKTYTQKNLPNFCPLLPRLFLRLVVFFKTIVVIIIIIILLAVVEIAISRPAKPSFGVGPGAGRKFAEPRDGRGGSGGRGTGTGGGGVVVGTPPLLQTAPYRGYFPSCSARIPPSVPRVLVKKPL